MAGSVRCFMKLNISLLSRNVTRHIGLDQTRTLFSEESLGITRLLDRRDQYKKQFENLEDGFRKKMQNYVDSPNEMIFSEDLKSMIHLAESTPADKELLVNMIKKYNSQPGEMRFSNFTFGPVVMRSLYHLNAADEALKLFTDPEFAGFFNQLTSYQVLLQLLYKNKRYADMRSVYDTIKETVTEGRVHPKNGLILVTAGCYKENTPESLSYALAILRDLDTRGIVPLRRILTHVSALALKQGQPHITLEILTNVRTPRYICIRCIKIMAYADLNRIDDVVPFFRSTLNDNNLTGKKESYFADTVEAVEQAIERTKTASDAEIVKLLALVKAGGHIQTETLDDHINEEVVMNDHSTFNNSFRSNRTYQQRQEPQERPRLVVRPGLRDLV